MDILQAALIFSIIILSIFLSLIGIQVFFILRDLKKTLDKFNRELKLDAAPREATVSKPAPIKIFRRHAPPPRRLFKKMR